MKLNNLIRIEEAITILVEQTDTNASEIIDSLIGVAWSEEEAFCIKDFVIDAMSDY